jgi:hypothetical protein
MAKGKYQRWLKKEGLVLLEGWARDGLTDEQIAKNIGINVGTLYEWKNKYPKISEALRKGKEVVDREVENALLKRAKGYEYKEIVTEVDNDGNVIATKVTTKHERPDTRAQEYWLRNRKPKEWRKPSPLEEEKLELDKRIVKIREEEQKTKGW